MLTVALLILGVGVPVAITRLAVVILARRYPASGDFHDLDGIRLHVLDRPAVPSGRTAVICVHGASGNARDPMNALASSLDGRYRVIAPDRPGHGHSGAGDPAMSDPRRQADLIARLCALMGVERAIVVGHSWGGAVAAALALHHPHRVAGLVLVAPATHPWEGGVGWRSRLNARPIAGWLFSELLAMPAGLVLVDSALRKIFAPDPVPEGYRAAIGAAQALRPRSFRVNNRDLGDFYDHVADLSRSYHKIAAPTAIVTGDTDRIVSPSTHACALARDIPGATLTVIRGGGHMPHWTATATVVAAIDEVARRAADAAEAVATRQAAE